ncbi:MAG: FeoA family protein, partial [Anaerotignaceae bacterium]
MYTLVNLKEGEIGIVQCLTIDGSIRRRLLDIGLIEGTKIECLQKSPSGDPTAYLIRGAVIAIRSKDCKGILIKLIKS